MGRDLYIADWHYGDADIIDYDDRPFLNVGEMNQALIANWKSAVEPEDTVYVLGDMFQCSMFESVRVLDTLPGKKVLVPGNHDVIMDRPVDVGTARKASFRSMFTTVKPYLEVHDNDTWVVLSHYPMPVFKNSYYGWVHLYGHVHKGFEAGMMERNRHLMERLYNKTHQMINVGAMMPWMGYTPRTLQEIIHGYELRQSEAVYAKEPDRKE